MNLRRRTKEHAEVSTESLNDIMFFLLLFFLIVAILGNPNVIKLMLPNSKKTSNVIKKPLELTIDKDHNYL
ncbi:MAG TPA: biopolymer transporter ExbD, partial [Bacteroidia bacterium]|nr:biopolymer transporter ExbD [Bacteroidia bacterium]